MNYKMGELNPLYYGLIDSNDVYYKTEEAKPYLDLKIIHTRYTYDFSTGKPIEIKKNTKLDLKNC